MQKKSDAITNREITFHILTPKRFDQQPLPQVKYNTSAKEKGDHKNTGQPWVCCSMLVAEPGLFYRS
jgi:hypothetical protein